MESFFKEAVGSLKTSGTIRPSSKYLVNDCLKDIDFAHAETIVEFGAGNGCITDSMAQQLIGNARLFSFELNPKFYDYCTHRFESHKGVHIVHANALNFRDILHEYGLDKVDHVVSSLPLSLLSRDDSKTLLNRVAAALKPGGYFIQFQYSFGSYLTIKQIFDEVKLDITWRNLPPAVIYKCRMKG